MSCYLCCQLAGLASNSEALFLLFPKLAQNGDELPFYKGAT
jgi:hypothetical protein